MDSHCLLVVEDDPRIAALICHLATDAGFQAHSASGQRDIIKMHASLQPDVIMLDIFMPDMDGFEVLLFLRHKFSKARIILMSGDEGLSRTMAETMAKAWGLTIEASLSKPFQTDKVRALLEKIKTSLNGARELCESPHGNRQ